MLISNITKIISSLKNNDEYFLSDLVINSKFIGFDIETTGDFDNSVSPLEIENLESLFLICYETDSSTNLNLYFGIEAEEVKIREVNDENEEDKVFTKQLVYSEDEINRLNNLYGSFEPQFQFSLPSQDEIPPGQNNVNSIELSYDSLSSLGSITTESFSVTANTGSTTGLILESKERISDIGGVSGAGLSRTINNLGSTIDTSSDSSIDSSIVTTSGY